MSDHSMRRVGEVIPDVLPPEVRAELNRRYGIVNIGRGAPVVSETERQHRRANYQNFAAQQREINEHCDTAWRHFLVWLDTGELSELRTTYAELMYEPNACPGLVCKEWAAQLIESMHPHSDRWRPESYPGYVEGLPA